jgi:nucleoside-diphosphate-sugar epimerase
VYNIINPHLKALQPAQVHHVVAQLRNLGHQVHCFLFERETLRDRDRERDRDRDRQRDRETERERDIMIQQERDYILAIFHLGLLFSFQYSTF